jgi:hypothetical protein
MSEVTGVWVVIRHEVARGLFNWPAYPSISSIAAGERRVRAATA